MKIFPSGIKIAQSKPWFFDECDDAEAVAIAVLRHLENIGDNPRYLGFNDKTARIVNLDTEFSFREFGSGPQSLLRVCSTKEDYLIRDFSNYHTIEDVSSYIEQVCEAL
ncbi:MAG: hypothetical protein M0R32_09475 [Candidatus Cloacimonetes bacterium]|jgi:hypothetical protein|nr:hypothetical protein [Candidatus Cloacimonadota bacterium]